MPTRNIVLTQRQADLVERLVSSGRYQNASEVLREALRLLEERDRLRALRIEELRGEIKKGLDSGEAVPLDIRAIKERGRARLAATKAKRKT